MRFIKYHNYLVYENGDVYSLFSNKFLSPDIVLGYKQITLAINKKPFRIKIHRLVALLFLGDPPKDKECINHKDGNKMNNHFSNLEWCSISENNKHAREMKLNDISLNNKLRWLNDSFREKTSKKFSEIRKGKQTNTNNPNFKYLIKNKENGKIYSRQELSKMLNYALSTTDEIIKAYTKGKIHPRLLELNIEIINTKILC